METVIDEALRLSEEERRALLRRVLESLGFGADLDLDFDEDQVREFERRAEAIESGEEPTQDAFAAIDEIVRELQARPKP